MTQRYTIQFMIRISEDLRERLEQDAVAEDRSMAYIARKILENHYDISSKKESFNAYESELNKLSTPIKPKPKPVPKKG